jgi:hypothetical protein
MTTSFTIEQFIALGNILLQTQTINMRQWDEKTYARAIGWGHFFEATMIKYINNNNHSSSSFNLEENITNVCQCLKDKKNDANNQVIYQMLSRVTVGELKDTCNLIDRYILHSPYIDLNQQLLVCVLQRTPSKSVEYLKDRYFVDTTLQVAHQINSLLQKAVANSSF